MAFMTFCILMTAPYVVKNKNLKESTRTGYWVGVAVLLILYIVFGIIL